MCQSNETNLKLGQIYEMQFEHAMHDLVNKAKQFTEI